MNLSQRVGRGVRALVCFFLAITSLDAAAAISGIVFRDYNSNGLRDTGGTAAAVDLGLGGVGVRAYDTAGACGTATTTSTVPASIGTYSLVTTGCAAGTLRIEFSGFPAGLQASFHGRPSSGPTTASQAGTSVQFAADGTTNLELALNEPLQYCQNDPVSIVAEQAFGDPQNAANAAIDSVVRFPYSVSGSTGTPQPVGPTGVADVPVVGTVYGLAFNRFTDQLYMGAYHKRHAGFGPSGTGAIYRVNAVSSGAPGMAAVYADLNALFGAGTAGTDSVRGNYEGGAGGDQTWDQVGKSSLGDLELSPDGSRLYVVNLTDRQLYSIPTSGAVTAGTVTRVTIPSPCANDAADARPFGLKFHSNGLLYVGGVCSAQSDQVRANLSAYIYTFDSATSTFSGTPVFQFALNYPRAAANQDSIADPTGDVIWRAWSGASGVPAGSDGGVWAQPMLADVAFDGADLLIGLRDRHGDQTGTGNGGTIRGYSGGELLRACSNGAGGWNLEQNGSCGGITGAVGTATNQARGPAAVGNTRGGEYYALDHYSDTTPPFFINDTPPDYNGRHDETTQGGIAQTPGFPNVMATVMDPFSFNSGGVRWFWNTDPNNVALTRAYRIFLTGAGGFSKANGLGDLEALCRAAPLEVGNYVWNDIDHDGVMDPGEPPIAGVVLNLYTPAGVLLGTATTGAAGEFYFVFSQGATDPSTTDNSIILPDPYFASYVIAVAPSNFNAGGPLVNFAPTLPNNAGPGDGLLRDSNGVPVTVPGVGNVTGFTVAFNGPGGNNHTIDFGFGALDFGDLPDAGAGTAAGNYNTLNADNGAAHGIAPGLFLGATVDAESDGQPGAAANGDDTTGVPDDEDGITVADLTLRRGATATIRANATNTGATAAQLCGFVDFNGDGDFLDAGETAPSVAVPAGSNNVQFTLNFGTVPLTAVTASYARFRLGTTAGACTATGIQADGEVEDYPVAIASVDFGDLPDTGAGTGVANYNTLEADNGPSHVIVPGLFMGATVDPEGDGQPNAAANGDDSNGTPDDEDGVAVGDLNLIGGTSAAIRVTVTNTSGSAARLCGFIDYNGDGTLETTATLSVPTGTVAAVQTLNFGTVPVGAAANTYARFRLDNGVGACTATGAAASGEVEDYPVSIAQLDFGDAPNTYGTLLAQNGARHPIIPALRLGANEDAEGDGQPNAGANGDDASGVPDDEDGVVIGDLSLIAGTTASIRVGASNTTGQPAQLCGFVDFNGDGDFLDAGESAAAVTVPNGSVAVVFPVNFGTVPLNAAASTYARFRLSTDTAACAPVGQASNGEVEDNPISIGSLDFGDLPDTGAGSGPGNYATTTADNGPRHVIDPELFLGNSVDAEGDGQPNATADGDDSNGTPDDEDGVVIGDLNLTAGTPATIRVNATNTLGSTAQLCGFVDFNGDGDFADAGETAPAVAVPPGSNVQYTLNFGSVPVSAVASTYARFRLSTDAGACPAVGQASNGEVEDYRVSIGLLDLGDLPDTGAGSGTGNYATLLSDSGASHAIVPTLFMGASVDAEADGQPTAAASGDDSNGTPDDEDGVTAADLALQRGVAPNVRVNVTNGSGSPALLCGFVDYNGDGDFADAGETAQTGVPNGTTGATLTLTFGVVPNTAVATSYARFRLSNDQGCAPAGASASGEVEDYPVNTGSGPLSLGNLVWNDRNNDGNVDAGEPGIAGVTVRLYQDSNNNNSPDGPAVATTATDAAGVYLFQNLDPDTYLVEIVPPTGYVSSSGSNLPYIPGGPYEPAPDPDNDVNDDDNGSTDLGGIRAASVTLTVGGEPVNDGDTDANTNLSVDFGLLGSFDLALVKAVTAGQPGPFVAGNDVSFDITVINQGGIPAYSILVNDYIPAGFALSPLETNWTSVSATLATRTIAGPLAPGASSTVTILLRVQPAATSPLVNRAEIGSADDDTDPSNTPPTDIDSTPDSNPGNDGGGAPNTPSDDATGGNGSGPPGGTDPNGDEDDADPASIALGGGGGPSLGLAKSVQVLAMTGGNGGYGTGGTPPSADLAYVIVVRNYSAQAVTSLQVVENLVTTFGTGNNWNVSGVTSAGLTVNGAYDGRAVTNLLSGSDTLAPGTSQTIRLVVSVRFTPGLVYTNQVTGTGVVGGLPVSDLSTDGSDPTGGGTDPGTVQVPTTIRLGAQSIPALGTLGLLMLLAGLAMTAQLRLRRRGAAVNR